MEKETSFMGCVTFIMEELATPDPIRGWFLLKKINQDQIVSGELDISMKYTYAPEWSMAYNGAISLASLNYGPALTQLTEAINNHTTVYIEQLYALRANASLGLKQYEDAIKDIDTVLSKDKRNKNFWFTKGRIFFEMGSYDAAKNVFQEGLKYIPHDELLTSSLKDLEVNSRSLKTSRSLKNALLMFQQENYHDAYLVIARELISESPTNHIYYWYRSLASIGQEQFVEAEQDIMKAISLYPNWPKENPTRQGEVRKQGQINIRFQRRYFYLKDRFLFYYKKRDSIAPKGVIITHKIATQVVKKDLYIRGNKRIYRLQGKSESEMVEWKRDIDISARLPLSFTPDNDIDQMQLEDRNSTYRRGFPLRLNKQNIVKQVVADGVDYEGWLFKQGEIINKDWKRRYFVLKKEYLYYFVDKPIPKDGVLTGIKGTILITKYTPQNLQDPPNGFQLASKKPGERSFFLYAESKMEKDTWMLALKSAIQTAKASFAEDSISLLRNPTRRSTILFDAPSSLPNEHDNILLKDTPVSKSLTESTIIRVRDESQSIGEFGVSSSERKYFRKYDLEYDTDDGFAEGRIKDVPPKSFDNATALDDLAYSETDDENEYLLDREYGDYGTGKCCSKCTIS